MEDRFACVCNLVDGELQEDWYKNNESYSCDAVEKALYKAYDMGARNHHPKYAAVSSLISQLAKAIGPISSIDGGLYYDLQNIIREIEDELDTSEDILDEQKVL